MEITRPSGSLLDGNQQRYRAFDSLQAQSAATLLTEQLSLMSAQSSAAAARKADLDSQLETPCRTLLGKTEQREQLAAQLERAANYDRRLSDAPDGAHRRRIHEKCEQELGNSRPASFISANRPRIEALSRDIEKLGARIEEIVRRATLTVSTVVVDGNNLCYQNGMFIGLVALAALVPKLSEKYRVVLIFDASIRRKLGASDSDIRARFHDVDVLVVASRKQADETVLAVADAESTSFALSNDRYVDFPDSLAVTGGRILRHDIVVGSIHVQELGISQAFELRGREVS